MGQLESLRELSIAQPDQKERQEKKKKKKKKKKSKKKKSNCFYGLVIQFDGDPSEL
jgi:hypothetical protein